MSYLLIVKEEAVKDAIEAYVYYENKQAGLGEHFLKALTKCYSDLSLHPYNYSFIHEDSQRILRDIRIRKFPYLVVFEIINDEVIVYAVHNTYRDPARKIQNI